MDILGVGNCLPVVLVLSPPLSLAATVQPSDRLVDVNLHPPPRSTSVTPGTSHNLSAFTAVCSYKSTKHNTLGDSWRCSFQRTAKIHKRKRYLYHGVHKVSTCRLRSSTRELSKLASHPSIHPSIHPPSIHPSIHREGHRSSRAREAAVYCTYLH